MGEVFADAALDTLKVLPFLLVVNFLIEFVEYRSNGLKADKVLGGGLAPMLGTAVGIVPQCGFSVVATELYGKRKIALGTLVAVYLATSDEALPIMLSSYEGLKKLWPILIIKVVFALVVGYAVFAIERMIKKNRPAVPTEPQAEPAAGEAEPQKNAEAETEAEHDHEHEHGHDCEVHIHGCHHHSLEESRAPGENATGKEKAAWVWRVFLKHPLIHTGTVILYIFAVNVAFGIAVYYVGTDRIVAFMERTGYLQPALAALVGLVPNCAASVVITELYVVGGLSLGGAAAGLCVSAGIGYAVLIKQNKPIKNTLLVIGLMYALSVALGCCITAFGF